MAVVLERPTVGATLPALGTGTLTTGHGSGKTTATVTTPIVLPSSNAHLVDNEANAVITGGNFNYNVEEAGAGAAITLGNGNNVVDARGGTATITLGTGNNDVTVAGNTNAVTATAGNDDVSASGNGNTIRLGNGRDHVALTGSAGGNSVTLGNGNDAVTLGAGTANTVTLGNGNDEVSIGAPMVVTDAPCHGPATSATVPVTSDVVNLGSGNNAVFLDASGNTIREGAGSTVIQAQGGIDNTFVVNAAGGTTSIGGFSLTNGDVLDLSQFLPSAATLASLSSYVTLASVAEPHHAGAIDTVLSIHNGSATSTVTLLNTGTLTLTGLEAASIRA